jgi:hypothetical protein
MQFTLTVRIPGGGGGREQHDLVTMRAELAALARVLDALVPGETVTIERIS